MLPAAYQQVDEDPQGNQQSKTQGQDQRDVFPGSLAIASRVPRIRGSASPINGNAGLSGRSLSSTEGSEGTVAASGVGLGGKVGVVEGVGPTPKSCPGRITRCSGRSMNGSGNDPGVGVGVGVGVDVGVAVGGGRGAAVGPGRGVGAGTGVAVGTGVFVGAGEGVGKSLAPPPSVESPVPPGTLA